MPGWEAYPPDYRQTEVRAILSALRAGECVSLVGLSGAGKSNLMGFLANRCQQIGDPALMLVDGNRAAPRTAAGLLRLLGRALQAAPAPDGDELAVLELAATQHLAEPDARLAVLLDRFDALPVEEQAAAAGPLRALRDAYKYRLTYVIATRRPLDGTSELAELFYANTLWLGPLTPSDALWSVKQYAQRQADAGRAPLWDAETQAGLVRISWGYPALLRACCEAHSLGCPLTVEDLRAHPAVQRRVQEFWADQPNPENMQRAGLSEQPLLAVPQESASSTNLTASEHRLLTYLQAHAGQVCPKDDLIGAVWPEERQAAGLRDDSLAQLIRRLRQKVEPDPSNPQHILTIPGRGCRYVP